MVEEVASGNVLERAFEKAGLSHGEFPWFQLSIIPFVLVMVLGMAIIMVFPEIALWLPQWYYGR